MNNKLDKIFKNSKKLFINDSTKIVIMSDCHRGIGDNNDDFIKNKSIYEAALLHYYNNGFIYIELGDGDEMWEIKNYKDIVEANIDIFKQLKKFQESNRLIMIYGNHDIDKKYPDVLKENFYNYYNKITKQYEHLLNDLIVYESLVLNYKGYDIFLIHGHQVDFFNSTFWRFSKFLVKSVWKNFELFGMKEPTNVAKNYESAKGSEKKLQKWGIKNNKIVIAGHTHRAIFPKVGQSLYFNDGSCIYPDGITCLEIENGNIELVKWEFKINENKLISVKKKIIEKKESIINFIYNFRFI